MSEWPKRAKVHLHSSKDSMHEVYLGIGGMEEDAVGMFLHALCEVTFEIDVHEDGTCDILSATDGKTMLIQQTDQMGMFS